RRRPAREAGAPSLRCLAHPRRDYAQPLPEFVGPDHPHLFPAVDRDGAGLVELPARSGAGARFVARRADRARLVRSLRTAGRVAAEAAVVELYRLGTEGRDSGI